jgi:hypothetical protein
MLVKAARSSALIGFGSTHGSSSLAPLNEKIKCRTHLVRILATSESCSSAASSGGRVDVWSVFGSTTATPGAEELGKRAG